MNKYQEALARIENDDYDFPNDFYGEDKATVRERDLDWIQELVDRETPMKPDYPKEYPSACCPKCSHNLGDNNFCRNCGQRINWSDDNES